MLILTTVVLFSHESRPPSDGTVYTGTIAGKYAIQLQLERDPANNDPQMWRGTYFYETVGDPIELSGGYRSGEMILDERADGEKTGTFRGALSGDRFEGTWVNARTGRSLPFVLKRAASFETLSKDTTGWRIHFRYPVFSGESDLVAYLNRHILHSTDEAFRIKVAGFEADYDASVEVNPFEAYRTFSVRLVSCLVEGWEYTGGAQGNMYYEVVNFGYVGGAPMLLSPGDLFLPGSGYIRVLSDAGMEQLRRAEAPYVIDGSITRLDENLLQHFTLSPKGLRLHFAPYQVGPYAGGPMDVRIPWEQLEALAGAGGPLDPLLNKKQ
jgi:hypothetical protein